MFCKKCGKEIPDDSKFCPYCSEKAGDEKKSKSNSTIIIACVAVIVALLVVIAFMAGKLSDKKGENTTTTSSQTSISAESSTTAKAPETTTTTTTTTKTTKAKVKCYSGTEIPDCGAYLHLKADIYEPVSEEGLIMYESPADGLQKYAKLLEDNGFKLTEENEFSQIYTSSTGIYVKLMEDIYPQEEQHYLKVISKNLFDYCMENFNVADNGI
ncbi:MAG: zinc ribbon domain-containing protein [Clostridia bacterium]|nr:zinc ribbon domain-containing protein [Clostridia bacterium]